MKVGKWSTTAANNSATPPDGWPEGQAPSTINDCAREMMASIKTMVNDLEYIDLDNTPTYISATTFSLGTADLTNWEVGRRVKLFDSTVMYATIISVSATFVQVRLDSGNLTSSLSSAALAVIRNSNNSLPDIAYRAENLIINGGMDIWQRGTTFSAVANASYTADRWRIEKSNEAAINVQQISRFGGSSNVPTIAQSGELYNYALQAVVTTADTNVSATNFFALSYVMEGFDFRHVAGQKTHLEFWVNTNKSGTYAVSMRNEGVSVSYVQNYTVSAVNTWQRVFMTFPEAPIDSHSWNFTNGSGLIIDWALQAGTTFRATPSEWTAMNAIATASQVNWCSSVSNTFAITGVKFGVGYANVPKRPRFYRDELARAQRYFWRGLPCGALNMEANGNGSVYAWPIMFPTTMRTSPAVSASLAGSTWSTLDSAQASISASTPHGARFVLIANGATSNANVSFGANDYMQADAELS